MTFLTSNSDCTTGWGNNHVHGFTLYYQHYTEDWFKKEHSVQLTAQIMPGI